MVVWSYSHSLCQTVDGFFEVLKFSKSVKPCEERDSDIAQPERLIGMTIYSQSHSLCLTADGLVEIFELSKLFKPCEK